jgi:uncharacterized protein YjbJ (UPF0337 family)
MWDGVPMRKQVLFSMGLWGINPHTFLPFTTQKDTMNKEQIKGTVKDLTGKAQEAAGKAIDDKEMQAKGLQKQVAGNVEKAVGDAKQGVKNFTDAVKNANRKP